MPDKPPRYSWKYLAFAFVAGVFAVYGWNAWLRNMIAEEAASYVYEIDGGQHRVRIIVPRGMDVQHTRLNDDVELFVIGSARPGNGRIITPPNEAQSAD